MIKKLILQFTLIVLLASAACTTPSPMPTSPVSGTNNLYPGPSTGGTTGYPAPEAEPAPSVIADPPPAPAEAPQPASGKASISGVFYSPYAGRAIKETAFYLVRAVGVNNDEMPAILPVDQQPGDIGGKTDDAGQFALTDVPPGNYYLLLWAPYTWRPAQVGPDDPQPRLLKLAADQRLALGVVYVWWP